MPKISAERKNCFFNLINQKVKKSRFNTIRTGANKLKTAKAGSVFGDKKGNMYDNNKAVAKIELMKKNNL